MAACATCGKQIGKVRGHYSKYVFDFPDGVEKYEPDNMDDWCTCMCVDGATMEQRKVIVAFQTQLDKVVELLESYYYTPGQTSNYIWNINRLDLLAELKEANK